MKILLTGATGYIGARILAVLAEDGHEIVALVRSAQRLDVPEHLEGNIRVVEGDLLKPESLAEIPKDLDVAYYLVHSMGEQATGFSDSEEKCAQNFVAAVRDSTLKQIIYLSGLCHDADVSEHMASRHHVEDILRSSPIPVTVLRAGIIVGSGSASFEIMRDLVEKLPIMIAPRWVYSRCQPIGIADVLFYLRGVIAQTACLGKSFEIGGPDVLTYRDMLLQFAKTRKLRRWIIPVPVLTPHLSSLWLFLITSVNFSIARALVSSLKTNAVCHEHAIQKVLPHQCLDFKSAIERAFEKIEQNAVVSSWKDALIRSDLQPSLREYIEVPQYGCLQEACKGHYRAPKEEVLDRLWQIGGEHGWYSMNWAWTLRGWLDRLVGGVGLRRGRTHPTRLHSGDALDFWRVLTADRTEGHLLLYAEMRLPGEAWLEWRVSGDTSETVITQTATFRPKGILGRLYWYSLFPVHKLIFRRLCNAIGNNTLRSP